MADRQITDKDRRRAEHCRTCPLCRRAKRKQRGLAYAFVKAVEGKLCIYCRAYERVYGRKAHEPIPPDAP